MPSVVWSLSDGQVRRRFAGSRVADSDVQGILLGCVVLELADFVYVQRALPDRVHGLAHEPHPQLVHHSLRCSVSDLMNAHDLVESSLHEAKLHHGASRFRRQSLAPVRLVEPPANLDGGEDFGQKGRNRESDCSDQFPGATQSRRAQPESMFLPVVLVGADCQFALFSSPRRTVTDPLHHGGIRADRGERIEVGFQMPPPKLEPFGPDHFGLNRAYWQLLQRV